MCPLCCPFAHGDLHLSTPSSPRLLVITLGLFSTAHVHRSMMEGVGGFSVLRLAGFSPSEVALLSTACTTDRYTCQVHSLHVCTHKHSTPAHTSTAHLHPPHPSTPPLIPLPHACTRASTAGLSSCSSS